MRGDGDDLSDEDAWREYPAARAFYDRQWLAAQLGYLHGPAGTVPAAAGSYFVKPVVNLLGLAVGAKRIEYAPGGAFEVPEGHFWTECFEGEHLSIDYRWNARTRRWQATSCVKGVIHRIVPSCWILQRARRRLPALPRLFSRIADLCGAMRLNVEFIGGRVIECHLRSGLGDWRGAPQGATRAIPVWEGQRPPPGMVRNVDDADGRARRRIGFVYA